MSQPSSDGQRQPAIVILDFGSQYSELIARRVRETEVFSVVLGYHGKLIKLAGGIFHTHHHLADGRMEVLVALGLDAGLSVAQLLQLRGAASVEEAFRALEADQATALGQHLAAIVERRSQSYVDRYGAWPMRIGAALFDRSRTLRWWGPEGEKRFFTLRD